MRSNAKRAGPARPVVVFLGRSRVPDDPGRDYRLMLAILGRHLVPRLIGTGRAGVRDIDGVPVVVWPAIRPALMGGAVFYALAPAAAVASALRHHAEAIVCQSPYEAIGTVAIARLVPRSARPRIVVDAHGDWQLATRFYGMRLRGVLAPATDRLASWVFQHADRVRTTSAWLAGKVRDAGYRGPIETTITFSDFEPFLSTPPEPFPEPPGAVFVGVLDRVKGVGTLLDAWAQVVARVPSARLTIVGDGPQSHALRRRASSSVTFTGAVPRSSVRVLIDDASVLVLPSRSEGFGRIIVEAMARGRPVIASDAGAIPELVDDGTTGILVPVGDAAGLAHALTTLLNDPQTLRRMSEEARSAAARLDPVGRFEASVERLARWAAAMTPSSER